MTEPTEKLRADLAAIHARLADPTDEVYRWLREIDKKHHQLGVADLYGEEAIILLELRRRGEL